MGVKIGDVVRLKVPKMTITMEGPENLEGKTYRCEWQDEQGRRCIKPCVPEDALVLEEKTEGGKNTWE